MKPNPRARRAPVPALVLTCVALPFTAPARTGDAPASGPVFPVPHAAKAELGRLLFFDKILSGNRNISCATCHHPLNATADALPLGVGQGGHGLGPERTLPGISRENFDVASRIPRNAPALFNLGASEFRVMFHDGRVESGPHFPGGFRTPAGSDTPPGLESVLAAQALFPPTSADEMAGHPGENPVADAAAAGQLAGPEGVWERLAERLRAIPAYVNHFRKAFPETIHAAEDITFVAAANAIAAFETMAFRADQSPYDRYLAGETGALSPEARDGMLLFFGKASCAACHRGRFQTDHRFHAIAMPQFGPGKGDGDTRSEDFGREKVTGERKDRYRFRTPSLRNVALTAPYGHCGSHRTLEEVIRHHMDPESSLRSFDPGRVPLPVTNGLTSGDVVVLSDDQCISDLCEQCEIDGIDLNEEEIGRLIAFLHALTDPRSLGLSSLVPASVPSGLPVLD